MNPTLRSVWCVLALVLLLPGCGNKGDLTLEPDIIRQENIDILNQSPLDPDDIKDEKKPKKKLQKPQ